VTSTCKVQTSSPGGKCGSGPGGNFNKVTVEAKANPNYSAGARRRAAESLVTVNETLVWAEPPASQREHARDFPHDISKRQSPPDSVSAKTGPPKALLQDADGIFQDDTFVLYATSKNVENPFGGRIKVFGPSPSGSTYTVSSSRSETNSVSASASLSVGFFEIFEASASIDVGYEETISESEGYSLLVDCPDGQRGISKSLLSACFPRDARSLTNVLVVYWVPLYTAYSGLYEPSRTQVEWYVANSGVQHSYARQCIGQ